jgi:short-subunit dehydrogenase
MQVSVVMPTYFESSLLESFRGPETSRQSALDMMKTSGYTASDVATDVLTDAARGEVYIVLPKSTRGLWWLKRWMPNRFLRRVADLHQELRQAK